MFEHELNFDWENLVFATVVSLTLLKVIHVLVVVTSCSLCCCRFMDCVFNFSLVLLTWPPSVNSHFRCRRAWKSQNNGPATGALVFLLLSSCDSRFSQMLRLPRLACKAPVMLASHAGVFRGVRISCGVGREEIRAPLKTPAWEATVMQATAQKIRYVITCAHCMLGRGQCIINKTCQVWS